jgi:hypothetical protein
MIKEAVILMLLANLLPVTILSAKDSPAEHLYMTMKQNQDLFVGEGTADISDFQGKPLDALAAAKERARADLAANIKVHVSSQVTENLESKDGKSSEEIKSQSKSQADIDLQNVKYIEMRDYPEQGEMTVLASLGKEDYRRQLAGKGVAVYRPENGLRVNFGGYRPSFLGDYLTELPDSSAMVTGTNAVGGGFNVPLNFGVDVVWRDFVIGLAVAHFDEGIYTYDTGPKTQTNAPGWNTTDFSATFVQAQLGYDWTPFSWRLQPFIPVRLEDIEAFLSGANGNLIDLSAGLGLRFWPNDSLALELVGVYHQGLNSFTMNNYGGPFRIDANPSDFVTVSSTGFEAKVGILWSAF